MKLFKESTYWQIWADACNLHKAFYGIQEDATSSWEAYIDLLEAEFRSCPVSRKQIERAFEVAISEVKSPELSYGNLSLLLCQIFRNGSSQPCLSDATQEQIRTILDVR